MGLLWTLNSRPLFSKAQTDGSLEPDHCKGKIEFDKVCFHYATRRNLSCLATECALVFFHLLSLRWIWGRPRCASAQERQLSSRLQPGKGIFWAGAARFARRNQQTRWHAMAGGGFGRPVWQWQDKLRVPVAAALWLPGTVAVGSLILLGQHIWRKNSLSETLLVVSCIVAQAGAVRIDGVDAPWPIREMTIIEKL